MTVKVNKTLNTGKVQLKHVGSTNLFNRPRVVAARMDKISIALRSGRSAD